MSKVLTKIALSGVLLVANLLVLRAQTNGSIVGTAYDASGAVIPKAKVSLTNVNTQAKRTADTDSSGNYVFSELPPGVYNVSAAFSGFQNATVERIVLEVSQTVRADIHFTVNSSSQQVVVSAPAVLLQTETSSVDQVVTAHAIEDLPLNGRDFMQLATLGSGVVPSPARASDAQNGSGSRGLLAVQISGSRADENSYLVDGVETTSIQLGPPSILLSPEAIQEFRLLKNSFDARYGQASEVVSMITKSGTNQYHGSAYEFIRNNHLDAANFFDNYFGRKKPVYQQNQFGFSFGGPILKNKLFFFTNYEGLRVRQGNTVSAFVPTPAQLSGNLSGLSSTKTDPSTRQPAIINPFTGQPFPNNIIPPTMISKAATVFSQYIPQPNANLPGINILASPPLQRNDDQFTGRIDVNISSKDALFGRYIWYDSNVISPSYAPLFGGLTPNSGQTFVLDETHTFTPSAINVLTLGFDRAINLVTWQTTPNNVAAAMGLVNVPDIPGLYGVPDVSIAGYSGMGGNPFEGGGISNTYQINDEFSLIRGNHQLAFGADIRRIQFQAPAKSFVNGVYTFDGRYSGNALADFLLGTASAATDQQIPEVNNWRSTELAFFVQDNYRVTPNLTLNLGLRYENDQPFYEIDGKEGFFDTTAQKIVVRVPSTYSSLPIPSSAITYDPAFRKGIWNRYSDFAPRIGFAYRAGNSFTVRGGYGLFYAKTEGNQLQGKANIPPLSYTSSLTGSLTTPNLLMSSLFPSLASEAVGPLSPFSVDPHDKRPYVQEWNLGIQHRIGSSMMAELAYVGSKGTHLVERVNINQAVLPADPANPSPLQSRRPYSQWGDILGFNYGENSSYNALQARLEKRFSAGLTFLASYTWSHSLDTSSGADVGSASAHQNMYNLRADHASSDFNIPQRAVISFT
ncbi:MAG TPA: TonB-dependent receptor, partial [Bryobacteraceae bacterium]|nr:TonB-dependent receptor [Bryobacteraceae bacterium]